jgi:hypothetical protein
MHNPFAISRRTFLTGLSAGLAVKALGCGGRPETNPGPDAATATDFRIERRFRLPSYLTADLTVSKGRILGLVTPTLGGIGDTDNYLFEFNPNDPSPTPSVTRIDLPNGLWVSQVILLPSERSVVTAHSGFYVEDASQPQGRRFVPFPAEYNINVVGGAVTTSNRFLIAASSATLGSDNWYRFGFGGIFVYDLDSNGDVQGTPRFIATSGANPTGLALRRNGSELVVLNSGGFVDRREPSIDLFDLSGERIFRTIPLPEDTTAQLSSRLALSPDEKIAIVGTADGTGRILFIDLENGRLLRGSELSGSTFHSGIQADEDFVYIADFYGEELSVLDWGGNLLVDDDLEQGFRQAGPSMLLGGELFQSLPNEMVVIAREI